MSRRTEPILNLPTVIAGLIAAFGLVHAFRELVLTPSQDVDFLLLFAFIPARYAPLPGIDIALPGGLAADIWTFVSYAFLHGDLTHLGVNVLWLLPFGSAVARRFGTARFVAFFAATAAAGALLHLATHAGELLPMIGASAAISGFMAAAMRFVFQVGGPLGVFRNTDHTAYLVPAAPLAATLKDPRILGFLIVWFGLNILFGLGSVGMLGVDQPVAWQAHIGGFVAGLLLFPVFDPVPLPRAAD
ncbi:rhomboid family intramembrane serine protease [Rhodoplanes sp. TEM]|uniref:Rhomboid family intramembrane serine protease n=1 Tax=Rhodoplanes tepidamans TaxID=200616 RepID=A0ABT5J8I4_RHOTP|nr:MULTISPECIES: rhomboid family intramembrane serine protease [Rhodoplanes]MDC7785922.1 rhomboid family intramembrane serine protease [Rhodoplanes tepidamans]MDC7987526.1 rhomboid family intramembrane serine protease [Rhodoplanes sp. TEM]MDQ0355459.1 membrane associated rhomboid family serine protease [Rhodoplanes tepidamans]